MRKRPEPSEMRIVSESVPASGSKYTLPPSHSTPQPKPRMLCEPQSPAATSRYFLPATSAIRPYS